MYRTGASHALHPKLLLLGNLCPRHRRLPGGRDSWPFYDVPRRKLLAAQLPPLGLGRARHRHSKNNHHLKRPILHLESSLLEKEPPIATVDGVFHSFYDTYATTSAAPPRGRRSAPRALHPNPPSAASSRAVPA